MKPSLLSSYLSVPSGRLVKSEGTFQPCTEPYMALYTPSSGSNQ